MQAMAIRIEWNVYKTFCLINSTVKKEVEMGEHLCAFIMYFGMGTLHRITVKAQTKTTNKTTYIAK